MLRYLFCSIVVLLFTFLLQNCAQMSPLTGGARDRQAPKLLSSQPPLASTGFTSTSILLKFDEYIQLKDLNSQLVVLPKLNSLPEAEENGKTLKITLNTAELKKNTTYRLYFGQAIVDMNEGNALKNFEYVFSTGSYIDSLQVKGQVFNSFNNAPLENVLIGLYEDSLSTDSSVFKEAPHYITKTDVRGQFSIAHLPAKRFKAYALEDGNKNLSYDPDVEKIGFLNTTLQLPEDSFVRFHVFREIPARSFVKKTVSPYYGHSLILFNKKPDVQVQTYYPEQQSNLYIQNSISGGDTLLLFYKNMEDSLKLLVKHKEENRQDTLLIRLAKKSFKRKKFAFMKINTPGGSLKLGSDLHLSFISWMDTLFLDSLKISLRYKEDTTWKPYPLKLRWLNVRELKIASGLPEGKVFELKLDTNAFIDAFLNTNDSARFAFTTQSRTELGKAVLKFQFYKKEQYLIQLLNDKQESVREQSFFLSLSSSNNKSIEFTEVPAGAYTVRVVYDLNKNEKWDTGNLLKKKQAEPVFIHPKTIKVLSDWEIEEDIPVKEEKEP